MSNKKRWGLLVLLAGWVLVIPLSAQAWKNHTLLNHPIFKDLPGYQEAVTAEPLEGFLVNEKEKIGALLIAEEEWARAQVKAYPACPPALDFSASKENDLRLRFLKALRLNPEMKLPLFVMLLPGVPQPAKKPLSWSVISVLAHNFENTVYMPLQPGEKVRILDVLATAADEPDNGLDIGLWEDNDTAFGKEYQYGKQPFGNPKLDYGTQAPFHMGFYHESGIVYKAAPPFQKTFPEQRAHLFHSLAKLAFETGHPYWGYRFAGWGLHYLQDMTMPYHTTIMPGRSTLTMLSIAVLDMIGIHGPKASAVSEVSRAHILIEKLLYQGLHNAYQNHNQGYTLFKVLGDSAADRDYPVYFDRFVSRVAARESRNVAKALYKAVKGIVTDKEGYRDIEKTSEEGEYDARKYITKAPEKSLQEYNRIIENLMRSTGAFSRIYMRSLK
ncbi:MAG: phospholipase [Thermodesulfobacteriota bacterium]